MYDNISYSYFFVIEMILKNVIDDERKGMIKNDGDTEMNQHARLCKMVL